MWYRVGMWLSITTTAVTFNLPCLSVHGTRRHLEPFTAAHRPEISGRQPLRILTIYGARTYTAKANNTTTNTIVNRDGTTAHLAQGQGFKVFGPERRSVGTEEPVVWSQIGGVDVPRVAGSEVVGQVPRRVLFSKLIYELKRVGCHH